MLTVNPVILGAQEKHLRDTPRHPAYGCRDCVRARGQMDLDNWNALCERVFPDNGRRVST